VSERLGHEDVQITLKIYAHVLPADQDQAARLIDELFPTPGENVTQAEISLGRVETKNATRFCPCGVSVDLPGLDSNQDKRNQNPLCYRYTTG
jgi:hypothetical protein